MGRGRTQCRISWRRVVPILLGFVVGGVLGLVAPSLGELVRVPPYAVLATLGLALAGARATRDLWEPGETSDHVGGPTTSIQAAERAADQVESALGAAAWVLLLAGVANMPGVLGSLPLAILILLAIPATWMLAQWWVKRARRASATSPP